MADPADPLHDDTAPDVHWTTVNVGEAIPGVQTPLSWTTWRPVAERMTRVTFRAVGAFSAAELPYPPPAGRDERLIKVFYGRATLRADALAQLGDRMPGTTGAQVLLGLFGEVPEAMAFSPTRRRYPHILAGLMRNHLTIAGRLRQAAQTTVPWWHERLQRVSRLDTTAACAALFAEACERFYQNVLLQTMALFCAVQPVYDVLSALAGRAGVSDVSGLTSGYGGVPESAMVGELWRCSRGELPVSDVVRRFGHHGPLEGALHGLVWREDDAPLRRMVEQYAALGDDRAPGLQDEERTQRRRALEAQLIAGLPALARPAARALVRHAARVIPLRGLAKDPFLQGLDVARAAARRAGELHATAGRLEDREDVFHLTMDELCGARLPDDIGPTISLRRARREEYLSLRLPPFWRGDPIPLPRGEAAAVERLEGIGVSPGRVEGLARVVTDPTFAEVEEGEILVSATTDPSWASIMFLSSALVVDIGGALSHAALVAREVGIPCVVNTESGSEVIRTGDRLRVDGTTGVVEILERAAAGAVGAGA